MIKWLLKVDVFMYCRNCGNELKDSDKFCDNCGASRFGTNNDTKTNNVQVANETQTDLFVYVALSLFLPIVGLILSIITKDEKPKAAKAGLIISTSVLVLAILLLIFIALAWSGGTFN